MRSLVTYLLCMWAMLIAVMADAKRIVVAHGGKADFNSIQAAINSLPDSSVEPVIIFIKKGTYREKIYIEKNNFILQGEDRDATIITYPIARDEWKCEHNDDWGVATMNIDGNDITLQDLTIINSYGFEQKTDRTIYCTTDTVTHQKIIQPDRSHQMALRTMKATRLKAINCHFDSWAGDTVSPWNKENGMFYFKDCLMEGGVDFYCPRGWAYAEGCRFIARRGNAIIWHDGSAVQDSKTVLKNCSFEGYDGFSLGRYHRDAQFYLVDCSFANNMADKPIYRVPTSNVIQWGERIYYYNCHRKGGDYSWFSNNLDQAPQHPEATNINAHWVFGNNWNISSH